VKAKNQSKKSFQVARRTAQRLDRIKNGDISFIIKHAERQNPAPNTKVTIRNVRRWAKKFPS